MDAKLAVLLALIVVNLAQPIVFPTIPDLNAAFAAATKSSLSSMSSLPSGLATSPSPPITCDSYCEEDTISVAGNSQVSALPDTAQLNIRISAYANTTAEVITILADKVNSVLSILSKNGLKSSNWQTTQLNIYPNTSYVNDVLVTYGQIASQSIQVKIPNLAADGNNLGKVYDGLAAVNGIEISGLAFDIADKTNLLNQARTEAYKNAESKARDYCDAAGVTLGSPITVIDAYSVAPAYSNLLPRAFSAKSASSAPTIVTVGSIKVNYNLNVIFSFV